MTRAGLRVLVVTLRYPPYVAGGYELLTRDAVHALVDRGHAVTVLAGKGERFSGEHGSVPEVLGWLEPELDTSDDLFARSFEGSNLERFRLHFLRLANYRATQRAIRHVRPDVVFFFNLGLVSLAPILAARHADVPTLGYVSDPWPTNHWVDAWEGQDSKAFRLAALRRFWNGFRDLVGLGPMFVCSAYLAERLRDSGIGSSSLSVLHLGVPPDVEAITETCEPPRRATGEPLRVTCLSSFWEGKGHDVLLDAVAALVSEGKPIEVTLAGHGSGAWREFLEQRAAQPDLAGSVRFLDGLDRRGVSDLLRASHAFVLPSVWGEPFPLATLEAMAHGLPVVVSDAGGSLEAIEDGVEGVVYPSLDERALADALGRLSADEAVRLRVGTAALRRARSELSHRAFVDRLETGLRGALR